MIIKKIDSQNPSSEIISGTIDMLKDGKIIVYPTDTIYGIGCDILKPKAVQAIQKIIF